MTLAGVMFTCRSQGTGGSVEGSIKLSAPLRTLFNELGIREVVGACSEGYGKAVVECSSSDL